MSARKNSLPALERRGGMPIGLGHPAVFRCPLAPRRASRDMPCPGGIMRGLPIRSGGQMTKGKASVEGINVLPGAGLLLRPNRFIRKEISSFFGLLR